jgi:hypothetical protein
MVIPSAPPAKDAAKITIRNARSDDLKFERIISISF